MICIFTLFCEHGSEKDGPFISFLYICENKMKQINGAIKKTSNRIDHSIYDEEQLLFSAPESLQDAVRTRESTEASSTNTMQSFF